MKCTDGGVADQVVGEAHRHDQIVAADLRRQTEEAAIRNQVDQRIHVPRAACAPDRLEQVAVAHCVPGPARSSSGKIKKLPAADAIGSASSPWWATARVNATLRVVL